ncbi:pituitary tumor-transforming gene 1 protein-interacting protein isoform X1 [Phascolarctos cinereus]
MEPRGPARAALLGPLLLLLLPLLLPQSGPAVSAQSAATTCSQSSNQSCTECLKNVSCFWCYTNNACLDYPVRKILPPSSLCPLSSARWGVCWGQGCGILMFWQRTVRTSQAREFLGAEDLTRMKTGKRPSDLAVPLGRAALVKRQGQMPACRGLLHESEEMMASGELPQREGEGRSSWSCREES